MALLASCGGEGGDSSGTTIATGTGSSTTATTLTSSTTSAQGTTTTAPQDPASAAKAKSAVLQAADIPADYQEQEPEDSFDQETTFQELATCLGVATRGLGSATSPTYGKPPATRIASTVEYFSAPAAQAIAAALAPGPKFDGCSKQAFTSDLNRNAPAGSTVSAVEISPLDFAKLGQTTSATQAKAILAIPNGPTIPINQDIIVVVKGDAVIRLTFLSPGQPFPADVERTLVEKVVTRA